MPLRTFEGATDIHVQHTQKVALDFDTPGQSRYQMLGLILPHFLSKIGDERVKRWYRIDKSKTKKLFSGWDGLVSEN